MRRTFAPDPSSVAEARKLVAQTLNDQPADLVTDVTLMVSELATNSIRYAGTPFEVNVSLNDSTIRVEVVDSGPGIPTMRDPVPSEMSGRGLRIVEQLSTAWGVDRSRNGPGKTTWFTVNQTNRGLRG